MIRTFFFLKKAQVLHHTHNLALYPHTTEQHPPIRCLVTTAWAANGDGSCEEAGSLFDSSSCEEEEEKVGWEPRINTRGVWGGGGGSSRAAKVAPSTAPLRSPSLLLCLQTAIRNTPVRKSLVAVLSVYLSSSAPSGGACRRCSVSRLQRAGSCFLRSLFHLDPI